MARRRWAPLLAGIVGALLSACQSDREGAVADDGGPAPSTSAAGSGQVLEAAENEEAPPDAGSSPEPPPAASEHVPIPAGSFVAGSTPGDQGREPVLEPSLLTVELGAFDIDRSIYRADPSGAPKVGVTREDASDLCAKRGRRLCTDLEWERACKGPDGTAYAGRAHWDPGCAERVDGCASGYGVVDMGTRFREWTASDVEPVADIDKGAAAVRGAAPGAAAVDHRCAHRSAIDPESKADDLSFRCCGGAPNAAIISSPKWVSTFRAIDVPAAKTAELFAEIGELRGLTDPSYFDADKARDTVLGKAQLREEPSGYELTSAPLRWNPTPGEEILLVTGKAGEDSFIVAFYILPDGRYRIGSSLVLKGEPGPIVFGYDSSVRSRLDWAICWSCPGEWGRITYRKENRVVITQE